MITPLDLQQLESHMKSRKVREQEAREPVLAQLRGLVSTLQSATEQMAATVSSSVRAEVQHQLHVAVGRYVSMTVDKVVGLGRPRLVFLCTSASLSFLCSLQESILAQVQRIVKGEVSVALKEQQAAVTSSIMQAMRSAAGTPVPSSHLDCHAQQAHILQLLQQGHLNQAFQQVCLALLRVKCLLGGPTHCTFHTLHQALGCLAVFLVLFGFQAIASVAPSS